MCMDRFCELLWWGVALYVIPTIIIIIYCLLRGENPFGKHIVDKGIVFMPGKNLIVAGIILVCIIPDEIALRIKNQVGKWKKKKG